MDKTKKKIFFFDLDGTLLTRDKKISQRTMDALKRFTDAGNYFCINTGRAIDSAKAVYDGLQLNFKGSFLCGSNGTEIYSVDQGRYVYKTGVPLELVPQIIELSEKYDVHCHTYDETHIVVDQMDGDDEEEEENIERTEEDEEELEDEESSASDDRDDRADSDEY